MTEATFESFHVRQTSGLTGKLAVAPSGLALAVSTPRPLCWGSGAGTSWQPALLGPSTLPWDCLALHLARGELTSEPEPSFSASLPTHFQGELVFLLDCFKKFCFFPF